MDQAYAEVLPEEQPQDKKMDYVAVAAALILPFGIYTGGLFYAVGLLGATYIAWRSRGLIKNSTLRTSAMAVLAFATITVTAPTIWYTWLGNYFDPELSELWSDFNCSGGASYVSCPTHLLDARDALLQERNVTQTVAWWATSNREGEFGAYEIWHASRGLVFTLWVR